MLDKCYIHNRKGFTLVELMIYIALFVAVVGAVVMMMSRGASNVQKGSFNALAANQASWIVAVMRNDIAKSIEEVSLRSSEGSWNGETNFEVVIEGGKASYSLENHGNNKKFIRKFTPTIGSTDFKISDNHVQSFGDEYMTNMTVTEKVEEGIKYFYIEIVMEDPNKTTPGNHELIWTASIYPPLVEATSKYWVPTYEVVEE